MIVALVVAAFDLPVLGTVAGAGVAGRYLYRGFCADRIRSLRYNARKEKAVERDWGDQRDQVPLLTSFGLDAAGEVYVTSAEGSSPISGSCWAHYRTSRVPRWACGNCAPISRPPASGRMPRSRTQSQPVAGRLVVGSKP